MNNILKSRVGHIFVFQTSVYFQHQDMELIRKHPINGVYTLGLELGRGGFSVVYSATGDSGKRYAVKTEQRNMHKTLIQEFEIYMKIDKDAEKENSYPVGMPRMYHYEDNLHGHRVLVMEFLGKSLKDRISERRAPLSIKSVLMIGIQAVSRLEYLHGIGVIHRDIKPDNLLTGVGEQRDRIYLSDFGLACEYIDRRGRHVSNSSHVRFCGTCAYASLQAHNRTRQSRRSDIESLSYTLVYLAKKRLPWMSGEKKDRKNYKTEVEMIKESVSSKRICKGLPSAFSDFLKYAKGLGYGQKPNYEYLRRILDAELKKRGERNDGRFDWIEG